MALAQVLLGEVSPSGKLPMTFPKSVGQAPLYYSHRPSGRGSHYIENDGQPLFPFGFGLSYARWELSGLTADGEEARVTVRNAGERDAEEVLQAYIDPLDAPCAPPNPSLCAFRRVALAAGESREVTLRLPRRAFTVVQESGARVSGGGRFELHVGFSQPGARSVELMGRAPLRCQISAIVAEIEGVGV